MAKRRGPKAPLLSLDEQLRAHDAVAPPGPTYGGIWDDGSDTRLGDPSTERVAWAKQRLALVDAIRKRDSKRNADPGHDASGNFDVSPYLAQGHLVRAAPKDMGKELPKDSQYPKIIATQRILDRYLAHSHITDVEWKAGNFLWSIWCDAGLEAKVTSGYEPVTTSGTASQDHKIGKRLDAVMALTVLLDDVVPYRSRGVVRAVVIEDRSASDWARVRGYSARDSKSHGLERLRAGLQALAVAFGY